MTMLVTSQTALKSTLDVQIVELRSIMERASQLPTQTLSTFGSLRGDSIVQGYTRIIQIQPTSVRLPPGIQVEQEGFTEVDLTGIPTETLQMVQIQVHEELREHELSTYAQNEKLMKDNTQLQQKYKTILAQLAQKEEEEEKIKKGVVDIYVDLPTYNIDPEVLILQIVSLIIG